MTDTMQRVVLAARPEGAPKESDFRLEEAPVPTPGDGEFLCRTIYLSLDPYMRGRMDDKKSYAKPVAIGGVMEGGTVSEVIASNHGDFQVGDIVEARTGCRPTRFRTAPACARSTPPSPRSAPPLACLAWA